MFSPNDSSKVGYLLALKYIFTIFVLSTRRVRCRCSWEPEPGRQRARPKIRKFYEAGMANVDQGAVGPILTERSDRKHQLAFRPVRLVHPKRACRRCFMKAEPSIYNATLSQILPFLFLGKQTPVKPRYAATQKVTCIPIG